jgi:accessory gene regulator B
MFLIESLSNKIGYKIAGTLKLDKDQEEVMIYGAFSLLQFLWSTLWIVVLGMVFNILMEVLIIYCTIILLRKYSGGVHASSPGRCTTIGTTIAVVLALIAHNGYRMFNIYLILFLVILSGIYSYYIVHKLAPVDSPAKPIVKLETKRRFKKNSIIVLNILYVIIFIILFFYIKYNVKCLLNSIACICVGTVWQSFTLTYKGHKILSKVDSILKNIL